VVPQDDEQDTVGEPDGLELGADSALWTDTQRRRSVADRAVAGGRRLWNVLVYSAAYLSAITAVQVAVVMDLLSLAPSPAPVVGGLVTFTVYAGDRIVDVEMDAETAPQRAAFVRRHRNGLYVLAAAAYGVAVALSTLGGPVALSITLLPATLWVLYAREWVPEVGVHIRRLKEVLLLNSVVVALAWAAPLVVLPAAFADAPLGPTAVIVFAYFFLGIFANTELPNVYDMAADRANGVDTLPTTVGVARTRQTLYAIDLASVCLIGYGTVRGYLPGAVAAPLVAGLLYSLAVTAFLGRVEDGRRLTIAAESEYVLVGLLLGAVAL
jgi:4-hydroxybenzoate polyprenyltransferase